MPPLTWRIATCVIAFGAVSSSAGGERLPLRAYTTADGLASSVILDVVADSRGFLWFATRDGLSRFDGSEFRTYTTDDGLPNPVVNSLLETRNGEYWVATNGGGVCRLNVEVRTRPLFTCRNVGSHFLSNRVNTLFEDRQGRLWLATDGGLFRIHRPGDGRIEPVAIEMAGWQSSMGVRAIHEDAQGRYWVGLGEGLLRLDADGIARLFSIRGVTPPHEITDIVEHGGGLWIGLRIGLLRLRPEALDEHGDEPQRVALDPAEGCLRRDMSGRSTWTDATLCRVGGHDGFVSSRVRALRLTSAGRLWISTISGLAYLDGTRFGTLPRTAPITAADASVRVEDSAGQLWIATNAGAFKLALDGIVSYGTEDGLGHPRIMKLLEDRDGSVYAVSDNWIINRFDGARFHPMRPRLPAEMTFQHYSYGAFVDRTGQWWLLTERGLYRLRRRATLEDAIREPPEAILGARTGLSTDRVERMFEDSRGDLWIATRSSLTSFNLGQWQRATNTIRVFREGLGSEHQLPLAFAEDPRGGASGSDSNRADSQDTSTAASRSSERQTVCRKI